MIVKKDVVSQTLAEFVMRWHEKDFQKDDACYVKLETSLLDKRVIVFISDLHLQVDRPDITQRFDHFLMWARQYAKSIYILGDLFHVWSGDDCADSFSLSIADKLSAFHHHGIAIYFMAGNRDFLLGQDFAARAGMTMIEEPYRLNLGTSACLLTHGDRYCLEDKRHQWFRAFTRNRWFTHLFLKLPVRWRQYLTGGIRKRSQAYQQHYQVNTEVSAKAVIVEMQRYQVDMMIHGHTHQPGMVQYDAQGQENITYKRFVLSDWDDTPQFLCYDKTIGYIFEQIREV